MSYVKDPSSVLDWMVDWSPWLTGGETITTSTWIVPDGITKDSDSFTDTAATIWLAGGDANAAYTITNRITTTAGRTDDRSIKIRVQDR